MKRLIYYPPGCYGTFVNWLCNTNKTVTNEDLPFAEFGNSHRYYAVNLDLIDDVHRHKFLTSLDDHGVLRSLWPYTHGIKFINTEQLANFYHDTVYNDLKNLLQYGTKILVLYPTAQSKVWWYQNFCEKAFVRQTVVDRAQNASHSKPIDWPWLTTVDPIVRARHHYDYQLQLGHNGLEEIYQQFSAVTAFDLTLSELRYTMAWELNQLGTDHYEFWEQIHQHFPQIKFVKIEQLRDNFQQTILDILNWFDIHSDIVQSLQFIQDEWSNRQEHKFKDELISDISNAILSGQHLDWSHCKLNFFDTVYLERIFRYDHGLDLKFTDNWPTNTEEFLRMVR